MLAIKQILSYYFLQPAQYTKVAQIMRALITLVICVFCTTAVYTQSSPTLISMPREMRGVWVATVGNIDWPSSPNLSVETLKREVDKIVSDSKTWGLNTIFLQVRPSSDAIYSSKIEPLSPYICSDSKLLSIYEDFDALNYWIEQCHKNGIELHAWINPFRVTPSQEYQPMGRHISNTHPEWVLSYGGKQFLDPGVPEAREYVVSVVRDIVSRYDVDGIHLDDYFYPYPVANETISDFSSFERYNTGRMSVGDWRRRNVTMVISDVYSCIKEEKPWVVFGVSPFGVWRNQSMDPRGSKTKAGITNYDILFADVCEWVRLGIVDYLVPQIYWESGNAAADFDELSQWWANMATEKTKMFVGHAIFKVNSAQGKVWGKQNEIEDQILKVRKNEKLKGSVFFSYRQFLRNINGLQERMKTSIYSEPALSGFDQTCDSQEEVRIGYLDKDDNILRWRLENEEDTARVRFYVVYRIQNSKVAEPLMPQNVVGVTSDMTWELHPAVSRRDREKYVYRVSAFLKTRKETALSERCSVKE